MAPQTFAGAMLCLALVTGSPPPVIGQPATDRLPSVLVDPREARIDSLVWRLEFVEPIAIATQLLRDRYWQLGAADPSVAASYDRLGTLYHAAGMYGRAQQLLNIALHKRRAMSPPHLADIAATLTHLGVLTKDLGRGHLRQAEELQREALATLRLQHDEDALVFAPVYTALGHLARLNGKRSQAESLLVRGLQIRRTHLGEWHPEVASSMLWLGWYYLRIGQLHIADDYFQRSQLVFEELGLYRQARAPESYRVSIEVLENRLENAEAMTLEAWQHMRRDSPLAPPGLGLRRFGGVRATKITALLLKENRQEEAWSAFQNSSGWGARLFVCLANANDPERHAKLVPLRHRLIECDRNFQQANAPAVSISQKTLAPGAEQALLQLLEAEAAWMVAEHEAMQNCQDNHPFHELTEIQSHLGENEAIIGWVTARWVPWGSRIDDRFWGYVIRKHGPILWQHLRTNTTQTDRAAWRQPMRLYEETIRRASIWPDRVQPDADLEQMAQDAYTGWLLPLEQHLQGISKLIVVREALQSHVPIECLKNNSGDWLLDRYVVSYVPSADLYATLANQPRSTLGAAPGRALILGDPAFNKLRNEPDLPQMSLLEMTGKVSNDVLSQKTLRSVLAGGPDALRNLPRLHYSRREVQAVAAAFPTATLLTGGAATETALNDCVSRNPAQRWSVVHLATHTLLDAAAPERSAIALAPGGRPDPTGEVADHTDGLLTAREIYLGWELHADLVTLSGCQTGSGNTAGNGHIGLAQAFLRAGAQSLLVSQWKVDDVATALLMERFYQNLTGTRFADAFPMAPMSKAMALTEAKQWLRTVQNESGQAVFAHPTYWAGFILLGDAR